ncbi:hypothetical protein [Cetobacterium somerae]|uniref:hypothetical protein n=1 Tax=Cetobacterium somerae TaxID=188913 RepID=UPI00248DC320|nr:hypothetical protein [Cetobacterium somerae]
MKKFLSFVIFLLIFFQTIFSEGEENIVNLPGKNKPAKMKIGVYKLKTEELTLGFNIKEKIIYGEIPNYHDELVFVSETLDEIPSLKTIGGKRIVHKIKKAKLNEPIKEKNITYEIIKEPNQSRTYIKISPSAPLTGVFIYLLDSKNYNVKKVYKGKFLRTLADETGPCPSSHSRAGTVEFSPYRNAAIKLGKYTVRGPNEVLDPDGVKATFITTSGNLPQRVYPGDSEGHTWKDFDPIYNAVRIYLGTPAEAGKNFWTSDYYVKDGGSFTSHVSIPNINANIRFYADSSSRYINFAIEGWEGEINQLFTIEYRRTYSSTEESDVIHRDYFTLKMPPRTIRKTIDVNIDSPIVQYNLKNGMGIVESGLDGVKTYGSRGEEFIKNNPWITVNNPIEYWGSDLGKHEVSVYNGKQTENITSTSNGGFPYDYRGKFDEADVILNYTGGNNRTTSLGVSRYNFNKMINKDVIVTHYYPKDNPSPDPAYVFTYRFNITKFDGKKYYDNLNANIKLDKATIVNYKPGDGGIINFGTIVLKDLDTVITRQSGGNGIRIAGVQDVFLKKTDNPNYPLIPAKLYFKNNNGSNGQLKNVLEGVDQKTTQDEVYITFDKIAEEKLIVGGIFEVVDQSGKSPLKIGTSVYNDNSQYYTSFGKLQLNAETRYIETTVSINNPDFPIDGAKGWLRFNASQYADGEVSGYPGIVWGSVTNPVDVPANANLEIFTKDWKSLGNKSITKLPIGMDSAINLAYKKGNNFIALGYMAGEFNLNGAEETYYLRFTNNNGDLLFTEKLNIYYGRPIPVNHSTTIEFLNPLTSHGGKQKGVVYFNGSNLSEGKAPGLSNSQINDYNGQNTKWFSIYNGIDYSLGEQDIIYIYDRNGTEYGSIDKFTQTPLKIGKKDGKEMFYLYYDLNNRALGIAFNGAIYDGKALTERFYLRMTKKKNNTIATELPLGETLNELVIKLPQFDPGVYFGFRDARILIDSTGKGKVGVGTERLVTAVNHSGNIDLKTEISSLGYYLEFLKEMPITNDNGVYGKTLGKVKVISNVEGDPILEGSIYFSSTVGPLPEIVAVNEKRSTYDIYLHLEPNEYRKLLPNRHYKIVDSKGEKDVINLGLTKNGVFLNKPLTKKLRLNTNLSFTTLPAFIEIYPQSLDFGKFNLHSNQSTRESSATIAINGNNIKNFSVKIANNIDNINIYKQNSDETFDQNRFIPVNNLRVEKISEEIKDSNSNNMNGRYINRIYKLFGTALFDPNKNLPVGNYSNNLVIEATIID